MKAMFRIYYSPLETKFKLAFDMYKQMITH